MIDGIFVLLAGIIIILGMIGSFVQKIFDKLEEIIESE